MPHHSTIPATSGIYKITCTANKLIYVGSTVNLHIRWQRHLNHLKKQVHRNQYLQHAYNKYGPDAFVFEVLELVLSPFLLEREQYWLDTLQPFGKKGFNMARSAQSPYLGRTHSPETRAQMRIAALGHPMSPEACEKIGRANSGKRGPSGKVRSPEHCAKLSVAKLGKPGTPCSPETKEKLRQSSTGHTHNPETRAKIGTYHIGKPGTNLGKKLSPEVRAKISAARTGYRQPLETYAYRMKTLIVTSPDGTEYLITGIGKFCEEHNLHQSGIMSVVKGQYSQHKGWKARYPEADIG